MPMLDVARNRSALAVADGDGRPGGDAEWLPPSQPEGVSRRRFLGTGLAAGSGALLAGGFVGQARAQTQERDLTLLSLQEAAERVRNKAVSPVELTQACLKKIEVQNPVLNAFITVTPEAALAQAREAERDIRAGKWRGPLHGIPIALKDLIDTAGVRTTAGSGVFADRVPNEDSEVTRRLKAAGAVLLGKLTTHEFAFGVTSVFSHFGAVRNPWDTARIAGGSSGGSGSAVAAGQCYGALGTDTGGSIRQPAAFCGIVGLMPTFGRVSTRGVIPLSPTLDHVGPMTRTVADAALMLQALAGYDEADLPSADVPVPDFAAALWMESSSLRLGVPRSFFYEGLDPEIDRAVNEALMVLARLTAGVREVELPSRPDVSVYRAITTAEAYAYHRSYMAAKSELYQPPVLQRIRTGADVSTSDYIEARRRVDRVRRDVRAVFATVDLLVTPTTDVLPDTIEEVRGGKPVVAPVRTTYPFNLYGLPTISVPCGFTRTGLPIGLQISGPPWGEVTVLRLAQAYERATPWHDRHPAL